MIIPGRDHLYAAAKINRDIWFTAILPQHEKKKLHIDERLLLEDFSVTLDSGICSTFVIRNI